MRGIFNKLEQGILVLGNKGDIKFCNKWLLNQLGWNSEKIEGKYFSHLFHTQCNEVEDLFFYSQVNQVIQLYDCMGEVQSFHIEVEESLWEDNKCIIIILKEYKRELFAKKDLENYLDALPFIAWIKNREGRYEYINDEYINRRQFIESYARDNISQAESLCKLDIIGKTDKDIWCIELAEKIIQKDLMILQEKKTQMYGEFIECKNEKLSCNVCKIPLLNKDGEVEYIVGIKSDIIKTRQNEYSNTLTSHVAVIMKNRELSKEIKEITKRNELTEEELQCFLDTATELMGIIEFGGRFLRVTDTWTEKLGWSEEELLQMTYQDLLHEEDRERTIEAIEIYEQTGSMGTLKNRYRCKDKQYIWLEWTYKPIVHRQIVICTIRDMTKEKQIEEEGMRDKIFSDMAHEFKTPLNIILAMMQLIQKSIEDGTVQHNEEFKLSKYVSTVKQNAYRLLRLMNNVVDMSRIDAGYYKINLQNYNIVEIIEDITMSVVEYTKEKDIEIIFDTEVEELETACDPDKIERIMLNLLSNAIKYVTIGGKIEVNLRVENTNLLVSVKDNGIGIPEDKLQSIFERFVQAEDILTKMGQGSGIGLSLVESLVRLHGGEVWAESRLGEGLEVFVRLPIHLVTKVEEAPNLSMRQSKVEKCTIEFSDIYNIC